MGRPLRARRPRIGAVSALGWAHCGVLADLYGVYARTVVFSSTGFRADGGCGLSRRGRRASALPARGCTLPRHAMSRGGSRPGRVSVCGTRFMLHFLPIGFSNSAPCRPRHWLKCVREYDIRGTRVRPRVRGTGRNSVAGRPVCGTGTVLYFSGFRFCVGPESGGRTLDSARCPIVGLGTLCTLLLFGFSVRFAVLTAKPVSKTTKCNERRRLGFVSARA